MVEQATLPNLDSLVELGKRDGVDIRPTMLRVSTDLYVAKPTHSPEEERHYTELALRLVDLVDAPTRAVVTKRLAAYPGAPQAVLQRLAREGLAHEQPPSAPSTPVDKYGAPAATDHPSASNSVPAHELNELFFAANAAERRLILINLEFAPFAPAEPIERQVAAEAVRRLETAALGHNAESFVQELERSLAISREQAHRLIADELGEPIVIAGIALGMPTVVLQRILLCLNPAISQSVQRVYELDTLREEIEPQAALRLLAIWRAAHGSERRDAARMAAQAPSVAAHQPYYWHVEAPARGTRAAPTKPAAAAAAVAPLAPAVPPSRPKISWDEHAQRKIEGF